MLNDTAQPDISRRTSLLLGLGGLMAAATPIAANAASVVGGALWAIGSPAPSKNVCCPACRSP